MAAESYPGAACCCAPAGCCCALRLSSEILQANATALDVALSLKLAFGDPLETPVELLELLDPSHASPPAA